MAALGLSACSVGPQSRADARPAAFRQLSPGDRQLVLNGQIRDGMSQDAVYIAWGAPDRTFQGRHEGKPFESWIYLTTRTSTTGPIGYPYYYGPYLGLYPGGGYYGGGRRRGGFGYYGGYYNPSYLYGPQFISVTDVPYRKAVFVEGQLRTYEELRRGSR